MADVYVSYASKDRPFVASIIERLTACGVSIFWDQSIRPGASWQQSLQVAMEAAKAILVIWTEHSVVSDWTQSEAAFGRTNSKLVPIRVGAARPPAEFRDVAWINWSGDDTDTNPLRRLLVALAEHGVATTLSDFGTLDRLQKARHPGSAAIEAATAPQDDAAIPKNRGFAFVSHVAEDLEALRECAGFLQSRKYSYWSYHESERDYQKPTVLEIEERMVDSAVVLTVLSPDWKRSEWTQRELAFARELRKPLFHLRFRNPGPTLAIAGDTFFDIETSKDDGFRRLGIELDKKGL